MIRRAGPIARALLAALAAVVLVWDARAQVPCATVVTPPVAQGAAWAQRRLELLQRQAAHRFGTSEPWRLGARGVEPCSGAVVPDAQARYRLRYLAPVWQRHGAAIAAAAKRHGVPAELILTVLVEESGGRANAIVRYPGYVSDEATPNLTSIGMGQMLLSTAQRLAPERRIDSAYLQNPDNAIDLVARFFVLTYRSSGFDPPLAASIYNGGSLRPAPGSGNRWKLANGSYVERFTAVFNASVAHLSAQPDRPVESFAALFRAGAAD